MDPDQRLFINLESMWEDFERSVESLITLVSSGDERRRHSKAGASDSGVSRRSFSTNRPV
jgi:hypothetical protein